MVCIHLHEAGQEKGQAAAALTGAPATAEAAAAEDHLKVLEHAVVTVGHLLRFDIDYPTGLCG